MPTWEEMQVQMAGLSQQDRNQLIAKGLKEGILQPDEPPSKEIQPSYQELSAMEARKKWEADQPGLSDEEVAARLAQSPEEVAENEFSGLVQSMTQNYQTSTQYKMMLEQELAQISDQIAQLMQRRNMIELAMKGQV